MLLGDSAVGKTCVLVRFKDGAFLGGNFIATVGIDFRVREMLLNSPWTHRMTHNAVHYFCASHLWFVICVIFLLHLGGNFEI